MCLSNYSFDPAAHILVMCPIQSDLQFLGFPSFGSLWFLWLPVLRRIQFKVCLLTYKAVHGLGPRYLRDELHSVAAVQARKRLRSSTRDDLVVTAANSKFGEKFFFTAPRLWNRLPLTLRRKEAADSFKIALKTFLHSDADVFDT